MDSMKLELLCFINAIQFKIRRIKKNFLMVANLVGRGGGGGREGRSAWGWGRGGSVAGR